MKSVLYTSVTQTVSSSSNLPTAKEEKVDLRSCRTLTERDFLSLKTHHMAYRMEDSCKLLPEELKPEHVYHQDCYQRFTNNLHRLKISETVQEQPRKFGRMLGASENVIFNPDSIFSTRKGRGKVEIQGTWTTESTTVF